MAPILEQHRIVESIDSYLSRLDAAEASLERVQTKLKAYRASVLKAAVEGAWSRLRPRSRGGEGRDYEPASVLLARILKERRRRWEEAELARMKKAGKTPKDDAWKKKYEEPEAPTPASSQRCRRGGVGRVWSSCWSPRLRTENLSLMGWVYPSYGSLPLGMDVLTSPSESSVSGEALIHRRF